MVSRHSPDADRKKGISARQVCATWVSALSKPLGICATAFARLVEKDFDKLAALSRSMRLSSAAKPRTSMGTSAAGGGRGGLGSGKTPVVGAVSRKGNVVARVIDTVSADADRIRAWSCFRQGQLALHGRVDRLSPHRENFPHEVDRPHALASTSSARSTPKPLRASGRIFKRGIVGSSTRSATSICRCTSRNFSSATIIATTRTFSERRSDAAEAWSLVAVSDANHRGQQSGTRAIGVAILRWLCTLFVFPTINPITRSVFGYDGYIRSDILNAAQQHEIMMLLATWPDNGDPCSNHDRWQGIGNKR